MDKKYTEADIQVLTDREHVRLRLPIYAGNTELTDYSVPLFIDDKFEIRKVTFIPAVYKVIGEIIDNSIDEFSQISKRDKNLTISADTDTGTYTIADNGRGIPIGKHPTGKYTPEVVLASLRSGRNFTNEKEAGVIGQNGIGSSMTNFCSEEFIVTIHRDGKQYVQKFLDGTNKIGPPKITSKKSSDTGTEVSFRLDSSVFKDISLPIELIHNRAIELAFNNPDLTVHYNNQKYRYKKGLEDLIKGISSKYFKFSTDSMEFFVIFDAYVGIDEQIFTWVNSSLLFDSGICNTQILNAFVDKTIDHLSKEAKKQKCEVTKNDIRQNLLILGTMKISNPQYDSQAKTRLTGPNLRKEMNELISSGWVTFAKKHKEWLDNVFQRAFSRHHSNADSKAQKKHQEGLRRKLPDLLDAVGKDRTKCRLYITEGDSASSSLTEVRDPETIGSFSLGGKINNVYGCSVAQVLAMGKLTDLLAAIGLVPGKKAVRSQLRFGQIIISTDADYDGADIFTTLMCLFFQFWPELFSSKEPPIIFRLMAPNVVASKGSKRIHFSDRDAFDLERDKYKGYTIEYMKGLGSMQIQDWEMIINGKTKDTLIPIIDDGFMKDAMELLFGPDPEARRKWLTDLEDAK